MTVNAIIRTVDYNAIQGKVSNVLGVGTSNSGYGQPVRSAPVGLSNKVTVNEWANLYTDIVNCFIHQTGSAPVSPTTAVEGATVRSNPTTSPYTQYDTYANTIVANRFDIAGTQSFTATKGSISQTWPGPFGSFWNGRLQCPVTVNFPSANAARHFFNSGGEIRFTSSLTGSTANAQTISWRDHLNSIGTVRFGGNRPGTGNSVIDGQNFYRLGSSYGIAYTASATGAYTSNVYRISARSNISDNRFGGATQIEFSIEWLDGYTASGPNVPENPPPGDEVYGTINLSVTTLEPTGVLQPAGTGNFTVSTPTVTFGSFTDSSSAAVFPRFNSTPGNISSEGGSGTFSVSNLGGAGTYYWTILHGTTNSSDFVASSGSFTTSTTNGVGEFTVTTTADVTTEGSETFQVQVRFGSTSGTVLLTSGAISITDTSVSQILSALIVGGGAGGGGNYFNGQITVSGGGGGSGGVLSTSITVTPGQTYGVAVGAAGSGSGWNSSTPGGSGGSSSVGSNIATGGTGGQSYIFGGDQSPDGGAGGSPNGVAGGPGAFPSANGGAGGNNGSGYGTGGAGAQGFTDPGLPGSAGVVQLSYPGTKTLTAVSGGLVFTSTYNGVNTIYTFTSGSGTITI